MSFRKVLLFFVLFILPLVVYTQAYSPPLRIEIETPKFEYPFYVIPMEENGVALLYETGIVENRKTKWSIVLFDTNLQKVSTTDMWLEKDLSVEVINSDKNNFQLCLQKNKRSSTIYNTYFIHYTLPNRKVSIYAFNVRDKEEVIDLCIVGKFAFYASLYNRQEDVFVLDLKSLIFQPLYPDIVPSGMFQFFKMDTLTQTMWVASTYYESKNSSSLILMQLDTTAYKLNTYKIPFEDGNRVNFCKLAIVDSSKVMLIGTYVDVNEAASVKNTEIVNTGIFSMLIADGKIETPQFFNFLLLSNQFDKNKQIASQKKDISLNLQLIIDEIANNDSMFVFIGEVFYPEYRQEYAGNYGMYGYTSAPTTVFAGYRYQVAYVLTFNKKGDLLWNTHFQYNDILAKSLSNILQAYIDEDYNVLLYYGIGRGVNSTIVNDRTVVQSLESIPLELLSPNDRITANYISSCQHWYGDCFIYHGYQTISSMKNNKKQSRKRNVLFINKLVYR